jgi:hypothetical protein
MIGMIMEFPGMTEEQYNKILEELKLTNKTAEGSLFHAAGPTEDGYRAIDVWVSEEAFKAYYESTIKPALHKVGLLSMQPKFWPIHKILTPNGTTNF